MYKKKIEGNFIVSNSATFLKTILFLQEFLAYKILYQIFCGMEMETLRMMKKLTAEEKKDPCIIHALEVRKALAQGNYGRFFKLYQEAPNMGVHLINVFIDKHRTICLQKMAFATQATNL